MTTTGAPIPEKVWTSGDANPPPDTDALRPEPVAEEPFERVADEKDANIENVVGKDMAGAKALEEGKSDGREPFERSSSGWSSSNSDSSKQVAAPAKQSWSEKINPLKKKNKPPIPQERTVCPEYNASFFSLLTFQWMAPLMSVGYQRTLELNDLWTVNPNRSTDVMAERLMASFKRRVEAGDAKPLRGALYDTFKKEFLLGGFCEGVASVVQVLSPFVLKYLINFATEAYEAQHYHNISAPSIGHGIGLVIAVTILQQLQSVCTNHFLYRGMIVGGQARAVTISVIFDKAMKLSGRAKSGGKDTHQQSTKAPEGIAPGSKEEKKWFKKKLGKEAKSPKDKAKGVSGDGQGWSNGRIINLMSTDTYRIDQASGMFHMIWASPISIILTLVLLLINITYSALAGFALLIIAMPLLGKSIGSLFKRRKEINKITDQRVGLMQEILQGVRFVKYFGWETSFLGRLRDIRSREIGRIQFLLNIRNGIMAVSMSMPVFASMLAFITYSLTNHGLQAGSIFSSLALFNGLRLPLNLLPLVIGQVVDASASIARIEEFLLAEEAQDEATWDYENKSAIVIRQADFTWERNPTQDPDQGPGGPKSSKQVKADKKAARELAKVEKKAAKEAEKQAEKDVSNPASSGSSTLADEDDRPFEIKGLDLAVGRKELIAVIGSVGSGKSSLLAALAGDMRRTTGEVVLGASRAFCPQYAWIQNASVKENIIFGKEYYPEWYDEVVDACALRADLDMLPSGDATEIGERGITVSGGQKQRLNIARAIYFNADIVLMDDPLSAVDAHVGRHIMDNAICGLLKDKCRVLATHQLHVLHRCDRIIWMKDGHVHSIDTFDNMMNTDLEFQHLMKTTAKEEKKEEEEEVNEDDVETEKKDVQKKKGGKKPAAALMQVEERATKSVDIATYKAYVEASGSILVAPLIILTLIISQGANITTSLWLSWWTSNKWGLDKGTYIGIYGALGAFQAIMMFAFSSLLTICGTRASRTLLHRAVTRVLRAPMSFFDTTPLGRITNRFSKDVDTMDNALTDSFRMFFMTMAQITAVFILIIAYFYYFAIALGPLFIMFLFAASYYRSSAREIKRHEAVLRSAVFSRFSEAVVGVSTIRAYGLQDQFARKVRDAVDTMDGAYFLTFSNQRWLSVRLDAIGTLLVFVTGILVVTSRFNVSPSISGLVLSYILSVVQMIQFTVRQLAEVENNMNSTERINYYGTSLEEEAPLHTIDVRPTWPEKGEIVFNDVQMRYREGLPLVLQGLSMHVQGGERIGVVGRTGAGKSSIMSTIFRLVEISGGEITIDGIDISTIGLKDLRSRLSIIPQDPTLFRGTVRSNLDPFNEHTDLELWGALRQADLVGENQEMSNSSVRINLDATVDEEGLNFSLGQRQLMALARALVRNSQIIVCDEATSSVDFDTDQKIQKTIVQGFKGKTLLCIAHRLKTIIGYDRICVMDKGRIAELDRPVVLYDQGGIFRSMCDRSGISRDDFFESEEARFARTRTNESQRLEAEIDPEYLGEHEE